jgi:hypothetical protein
MTWPHNAADDAAERQRLKPGELAEAEFAAWLARVIPPPLGWDEYWAWAKTMTRERHLNATRR